MTATLAAVSHDQETDRLGRGFVRSLALHGLVIGVLAGYEWWTNRERDRIGERNSLGAAAGITSVSQIPIARRDARVNPVANDTESMVPTPEKVKPTPKEKVVREDPDAIPLKRKQKKTREEIIATNQRYKPDPVLPNQVTSNLGQAAVSPLLGVQGSGGVGTATASPFGNRFGWYEKLLRERVAQKWSTLDVDQRLRTAPPCIVTFTIARDGNVSAVKIIQSSGNYAIDQSAQRAVLEAAPMPPLPTGFERNTANIEFWFELKR